MIVQSGSRLRGAIVVCLAAALADGEARQQQPQRAPGTLHEGVTAVLVDIVVRDRRGLPVRDLTQADFELSEDGVPQTIGSFTLVFEGESLRQPTSPGVAATTAAAAGTAPVVGGPIVTALVFDRLTSESRQLAVQAAQNYLGNRAETTSYIGIFGVDLGFTAYAPFTRNANVLRQALARMGRRGSASFNSPEQKQQKADAHDQEDGRIGGTAE